MKRVWLYLVRQESLSEIFIRYIFRSGVKDVKTKMAVDDTTINVNSGGVENSPAALKIVQRDQEPITAFAINQVKTSSWCTVLILLSLAAYAFVMSLMCFID